MTLVRISIIPINDVSSLYQGNAFDNQSVPPQFNMRIVDAGAMDSTAETLESVKNRLNQDGTDRIVRP